MMVPMTPSEWEQALRLLISSGWVIQSQNRLTGKVTVCLPHLSSSMTTLQ